MKNVFFTVSLALEEKAGVELGRIRPESELFGDLGCDSLDKLDVVMSLERTYGIAFSDAEVETMVTVGDMVRQIERKVHV